MPGDDKRAAHRVTVLGEHQGEIMVFEPLLLRDISRSGATIDTRFPLHLDSLHDLRLTLGDTRIVLKARVVHSRISDVDQDVVTYRSGVEFVEPSEQASEILNGYLEAVETSTGR